MGIKNIDRSASTIGEGVYLALRKNIIDLKLLPGEEISIKDISEKLEVSRSPVRDAILKLSKEDLVDTMPQKGTMVSRIDLVRVEEERFLRESLEEKVLLLCMEKCGSDDILDLRNKIKKQELSLKVKNYIQFLEDDDEFHALFFKCADKNFCWDTIQSMSGNYRRIRLITLWNDAIIENIIKQHERMVDCLEKKDVQGIIQAIKIHCTKLANEEKDLLLKYPDYFKSKNKQESNFLKEDFLKMMR